MQVLDRWSNKSRETLNGFKQQMRLLHSRAGHGQSTAQRGTAHYTTEHNMVQYSSAPRTA